ncbi:E3 ubiquitin-protein ligase UPL5 isoform X2 [Abrus precatorius]|uniref:HECT-type E3 ubiquitin transferase n=1 Tax=Abrus precatorius TaxID=3816 RepID=A0A8B8JI78_ABRPR|nr:E3 ubiquitin-protein ligase UPL5 isoform X2 [Abrus precatorius]
MSVIETPAVHHRSGGASDHHRHPSKRKFDDGEDEELSDLVSVRMKKEEAVNSWSELRSHLQFFVRMMSGGNTIVMQAYPDDSVKSIHERIQSMKGIPVFEQRLIYRGKQLQWEQTLAECSIQNDANLQLVGRMRSTEHPQAWQVINDMVSLVYRLCRGETVRDALKTIKGLIASYLNMTPRIDSDSASGYFQIFMSSNAPEVLVMLYMSPFAGNKDCADSSVRHFLSSCCNTLCKALHGQCARVVLEFCKLLRRVGYQDPLYLYCRSTFGSLLETAGVSYAGSDNGKGMILIQDIFPFVRELARSLLRDLDLSMESPSAAGLLLNDVGDFTAFLIPLRTGIMELQAIKDSMPQDKRHKDLLLAEEIGHLHRLYIDLLNKIEQCLQKMEQSLAGQEIAEGDNVCPAWSHYLTILKELNKISKLYDGAEEKLWSVLTRQRSVLCQLIVRYAKRTDEHQWILEHRCVTNFESRRHLAMMMFPEVKEDYEELHEMLIDRSQLLAESFEYIARAEPESLHAGLFMEFKNEEATGPGVLREWFLLVCQAIFNPQNALFVACPNDRRRFFPNPASKVHPLHLEYFSFAGRIIALALMHRVQVGIVFDRVFFLQLAGNYITLEDIRDADPCLYTSLKQILEMDSDFVDSDELGLTFVREVEELGHRKVVELCPDGKTLVVNSKNREKYVDLLIQDRFVTSISEQVSHFAKGFADILSNSKLQQYFFQSLQLEDLDWMLHGSEDTISVEDWKTHTEYNGYKETDIQISWFWEIVGRMTAEQRKVLLFFWTSVKYLPVEGFRGLASRLYIYRSHEPGDRLPSSHTCFYRLCFPAYSSMAVMQDRLDVITQEHIGCSFGTW